MHSVLHDFAVADRAALWPQPIRILIVIDGRINESKKPNEFGLGYVLETLRKPFAWWVSFHVDVKRHDKPGTFRFTQPGFDLDKYDQLWFFGDHPNLEDGADGAMTDADIAQFALSDAELRIIAEWMDRGGGVFATGDHTLLGAAKCSRIPRVRTMRRWTLAQRVPARDSSRRHDTLRPPAPGDTFPDPENDTVFQPIELVLGQSGAWPFVGPPTPHPLFQSTLGRIDRLPDHMHEGEVMPDDQVQLDQPLDIPGYARPEYPGPTIIAASSLNDAIFQLHRPRPRIVAYGETSNRHVPDEVDARNLFSANVARGFGAPFTKRFGLVGVYDGDPVGIGRVVVDSTWHHWLSYNLHQTVAASEPVATQELAFIGDGDVAPHIFFQRQYAKMQAYYRNVALWLATPTQRRSMLLSAVWGALVNAPPMEFGSPSNLPQLGEQALHLLSSTASPGMLAELANAFVDRRVFAAPDSRMSASPTAWSGVQADDVNRAIAGGIASALLQQSEAYREERRGGARPRVNASTIRELAVEGASRGNALLRQSIDRAAGAIGAILANLRAPGSEPSFDVRVPMTSRRLRVVATKLQFPDASDPALVDGCVAATIRIKLGEDVVAASTLERAELPAFGAHGAAIDLDHEFGEIEVQPWERLTIEVLAGRWSPRDCIDPEAIRFEDTLLESDDWVGERLPARSQAWRLWYRIEASEMECAS